MTAPTVILPGDDKAATLKARNGGLILCTADPCVDHELGAHGRPGSVVALGAYIPATATIVPALVHPGDHKSAVLERPHRLLGTLVLVAGEVGVDPELLANGISNGVKELTPDIVLITAIMATIVLPGDDIITPTKGRNRWILLGV